MATLYIFLILACTLSSSLVTGTVYNFAALGALPNNASETAAWINGGLLNATLARLCKGDTLVFPNTTFYLMGGILGSNMSDVTLQFDGTIDFSTDMDAWPRTGPTKKGAVLECFHFINCNNLSFTSSMGKGLINGNGATWWGFPGIGYLSRQENRPRLLNIESSQNILVENIILKDSPYW